MLRKEATELVRGTPSPSGPAGEGAVVAVNAPRRGALGPSRSLVGFKTSALASLAPRDYQVIRLGIRTALDDSPGDGARCDMATHRVTSGWIIVRGGPGTSL
jgi:hypothetical protein